MKKLKVGLLGALILLTIAMLLLLSLTLEVNIKCFISSCDKEDHNRKRAQASELKICRKVCTSKPCLTVSADAFESIDGSADPCEDFHKYTCGGYEKSKFPFNDYRTSRFEEAGRNVHHRVSVLVTELNDSVGLLKEASRKMRLYYDNCINSSSDTSEMLQILNDFLPGWPYDTNDTSLENIPLEELTGKFYLAGQTSFVKIEDLTLIIGDQPGEDYPKPFIMPEEELLVLPSLELVSRPYDYEHIIYVYKTLFQTLLSHLGLDESTAKRYIEEVMLLDHELVEIRINCYKVAATSELNSTIQAASESKWFEFLKYLLRNIDSAKNVSEIMLWIDGIEAQCSTNKWWVFLESQPKRIIANYLALKFIKNNINNVGFLLENVVDESFLRLYPKTNKTFYRKDFCNNLVSKNFGAILTPFYKEKYMSIELLTKFKVLFPLVREATSELVNNLSRIDDEIKDKFQEKLLNMKPLQEHFDETCDDTALANFYSDFKLESQYFIENVIELGTFHRKKELLNLFDSRQFNQCEFSGLKFTAHSTPYDISVNLAFLTLPMISSERPIIQDLASIGWAIGHEIGHIGNADLLYKHSDMAYMSKKIQCFINQYSRFKWQLSNDTNEGLATLQENLADHFAQVITFIAYEKLLSTIPSISTFIGLNLDEQQEYFVSQSLFTCEVNTFKGEVEGKMDMHSPWKHRTWGTLMNSHAFSNAFKCPVETFMNPIEKCDII